MIRRRRRFRFFFPLGTALGRPFGFFEGGALGALFGGGLRLAGGFPLPFGAGLFPGGAGRYIQRGRGYEATIVNGKIFMEQGEHTGALAGVTLRSSD